MVKGAWQQYQGTACSSALLSWELVIPVYRIIVQALRTCPVCRTPSWFVTPSSIWPPTKEEKDRIITGYKTKLGSIDCRHWNFGENTCPFGTSCFYRHVYPDGRPQVMHLRCHMHHSQITRWFQAFYIFKKLSWAIRVCCHTMFCNVALSFFSTNKINTTPLQKLRSLIFSF